MQRFTKRELEIGRLLNPPVEGVERPKTRGDCVDVPRPCPFVGCRFNLYLDVAPKTGALKFNFPDREPDEMPVNGSCALDVVDRYGGVTLEQAGVIMNLTRERIRQVDERAFAKIRLPLLTLLADPSMPSAPSDLARTPTEVAREQGPAFLDARDLDGYFGMFRELGDPPTDPEAGQ